MVTNRSNHSDDSFGEWSIDPHISDDQPLADAPANARSAVDGAQREQPELYRPTPYAPGSQADPATAPRNDNKGLTIAVTILALVAVALLAGAMAYFYFSGSKGANSADSNSSQSVQSASAEGSSTSLTVEQRRRAEGFQPPLNWRRCPGSRDPGDLNLVHTEDIGGNTTICQFATNVRNSFVEQYQLTEKLNGAVAASSPTTGKTYTTTCCDGGEVVICISDTNATVHIV